MHKEVSVLGSLLLLWCAGLAWAGEIVPAPESEAGAPADPDDAYPLVAPYFKVTDDLYRGPQPSRETLRKLKDLGVKTVINLRWYHSDRIIVEDVPGLVYQNIPIFGWRPHVGDVIQFLTIVSDKNRHPVFVHCETGADRTGFLVASYRVIVCGWSREEAIREMKDPKFGHHIILKDLPKRIEKLDVDAVKKALDARRAAAEHPPGS